MPLSLFFFKNYPANAQPAEAQSFGSLFLPLFQRGGEREVRQKSDLVGQRQKHGHRFLKVFNLLRFLQALWGF